MNQIKLLSGLAFSAEIIATILPNATFALTTIFVISFVMLLLMGIVLRALFDQSQPDTETQSTSTTHFLQHGEPE